jgi:hypothetical protein
MAYTLQDLVKLNPIYQKRYDPKTKTAYVTNTQTGKGINFLSGSGQQYGLGSDASGSNEITDINKLMGYLNAPAKTTYQSPYAEEISGLTKTLKSRQPFEYDASSDEGLQAAQENAISGVSRAASRRNMLYSDSNKSQMGKSALALVPQFRQAAFNEYQAEGNDLYNQLAALTNLENTAYGRYRDTVSDDRYTDETAYSRNRQGDLDSFNKDTTLAGLTGYYGGNRTLQGLEYDNSLKQQELNNQLNREKFDFDKGMAIKNYNLASYKASKENSLDKDMAFTVDDFASAINQQFLSKNPYSGENVVDRQAIANYIRGLEENGVGEKIIDNLLLRYGFPLGKGGGKTYKNQPEGTMLNSGMSSSYYER